MSTHSVTPEEKCIMDDREGSGDHTHQQSQVCKPRTAKSDAEFLGWQDTPSGGTFALYIVTAQHHPLYHSTVSERTLRTQHLDIPPAPAPERPLKESDNAE